MSADRSTAVERALAAMRRDIGEMHRVLQAAGLADCKPLYLVAPDAAGLVRLHDRMTSRLSQIERTLAWDPLPVPPLEGSDDIEPLRTATELLFEEQELQRGVADCAERIHHGRAYVYRMHHPQRATLRLVPGKGGWDIEELRGIRGRGESTAAWSAARDWLRRRQSGRVDATRTREPRRLPFLRIGNQTEDKSSNTVAYAIEAPQAVTLLLRQAGYISRLQALQTSNGEPLREETRVALDRWLTLLRAGQCRAMLHVESYKVELREAGAMQTPRRHACKTSSPPRLPQPLSPFSAPSKDNSL